MRRSIRLRPAADHDLDEHFLYLAEEAGNDVALRFLDATRACFDHLLESPEIGTLRIFKNPELEGLRMFPVRGFEMHLVFYRPAHWGIDVIRVLHGARDIERILVGEE